jgi:hypothetical protein
MAIPYNSEANQPLGLESVTINSVAYILNSVDLASFDNRIISRTDANGDRAGFALRAGSDQITGSMTLQRATDTTVLPAIGDEFTHDYDRSGTASTIVVQNVKTARSTDEFDTFEIDVVLKTYQG